MRVEQIGDWYDEAAFLRINTGDKRRSTADKSTYRPVWSPERICWIQDNCLGLLHKDAVAMIVERYEVSAKAAGAIIRRAREEE